MQYLSWAAFVFDLDGVRIAVDPFLAGHIEQGIPAAPVSVAEIYPLEAVLVSHAGADHFGAAVELVCESGAVLCGGLETLFKARDAGVPEAQTAVLVSGATYEGDGWSVKALDARHLSISQVNGAYVTGQAMSLMLDLGGLRVFHGGDTSIHTDLELYGRLYRPHVALVGVDGVLLGGRPIVELTADEAALAVDMLGASVGVPMHYRSHSGEAERFLTALRARAPHARGLKLDPGETVDLRTVAGLAWEGTDNAGP